MIIIASPPAHRQGQRRQGRDAKLLETRKSKWVENLPGHTGLVAPSRSFGLSFQCPASSGIGKVKGRREKALVRTRKAGLTGPRPHPDPPGSYPDTCGRAVVSP